ncbi:hypothetical protein BGX23_011105 [Mortierella sp. AD031]|nr:hypothetical protein BGX23_011105 [Mortierella sp. AD031]KAG0203792.1 hypothetical protein BGX33_008899 [Mortierella sp. NVP41]
MSYTKCDGSCGRPGCDYRAPIPHSPSSVGDLTAFRLACKFKPGQGHAHFEIAVDELKALKKREYEWSNESLCIAQFEVTMNTFYKYREAAKLNPAVILCAKLFRNPDTRQLIIDQHSSSSARLSASPPFPYQQDITSEESQENLNACNPHLTSHYIECIKQGDYEAFLQYETTRKFAQEQYYRLENHCHDLHDRILNDPEESRMVYRSEATGNCWDRWFELEKILSMAKPELFVQTLHD